MTSHSDLVTRAVRWLKREHGCAIAFAEMVTASSTSPDAIGWAGGLSRLVEVKVSRADFFADRKKIASRHGEMAMGNRRWYLTPEGLVEATDLPDGWGLAYAIGRSVREVVPAPVRETGVSAHREESLLLTSAIRRLVCGSQVDWATGRWETVASRLERQGAK